MGISEKKRRDGGREVEGWGCRAGFTAVFPPCSLALEDVEVVYVNPVFLSD